MKSQMPINEHVMMRFLATTCYVAFNILATSALLNETQKNSKYSSFLAEDESSIIFFILFFRVETAKGVPTHIIMLIDPGPNPSTMKQKNR